MGKHDGITLVGTAGLLLIAALCLGARGLHFYPGPAPGTIQGEGPVPLELCGAFVLVAFGFWFVRQWT